MFWKNFQNAAPAPLLDGEKERPDSYRAHIWQAYLNNLNDKYVQFPLERN